MNTDNKNISKRPREHETITNPCSGKKPRNNSRLKSSYVKYGVSDNSFMFDDSTVITNEQNKIVLQISSKKPIFDTTNFKRPPNIYPPTFPDNSILTPLNFLSPPKLNQQDSNPTQPPPDINNTLFPPKNKRKVVIKFIDLLKFAKNINGIGNNNNEDSDNSSVETDDTELIDNNEKDWDSFVPEIIKLDRIKTIDDLIMMGENYHPTIQPTYRELCLKKVNDMVPSLTELKEMVGLEDVKSNIINQILFTLQDFNVDSNNDKTGKNSEMMHTVIMGPPGVGKTTVARIIGKIYTALGVLSKGTFREVGRSDLIAKYLGQTAIKTQKVIDECEGGVMFIDEAYALGHENGRDSFSKECLDTLNKNLSDKRDFLCIISGYKKDLDKCFFNMNEGLKRRFSFKYNINKYDYKQLLEIFKGKVEKEGWTINLNNKSAINEDKNIVDDDLLSDELFDEKLEKELDEYFKGYIKTEAEMKKEKYLKETEFSNKELLSLFQKNRESFPYSGGDVETLFLKCKISHSRKLPVVRKTLILSDIKEGFESFIKDRKYSKIKKNGEQIIHSMYTN
jgi:SpoVK/Ycf46/Vps4 family AAA+-type ATPase